jgi:hypothetical protein
MEAGERMTTGKGAPLSERVSPTSLGPKTVVWRRPTPPERETARSKRAVRRRP